MKNIFVVSDTHNVFKDAKSPPADPTAIGEARIVNGQIVPIIDPVKEAQKKKNDNEYIQYLGEFYADYIAEWNALVRPEDLVIHLGDVIWDLRKLSVFHHLNGIKRLVLGNHDCLFDTKLYTPYFTIVQTFDAYQDVIFSHEPICPDHPQFTKSPAGQHTTTMDLSPYTVNVHGHFHYQGVTREFFRGERRKHAMRTHRTFRFFDTNTHLTHYCVDHLPIDLRVIRDEIVSHHHLLAA